MPTIKRTSQNPYGLSFKQQLVVKELAERIKNGVPLNPPEIHRSVYTVKNEASAAVIASQNLNKVNVREALYHELEVSGVFGVENKVLQRVTEGLNATVRTNYGEIPDYTVRLRYIQEIFKLLRLY